MTDGPSRLPDDTVTLTTGARMPLLGFGTWQLKGRVAVRATTAALETGYRHLGAYEVASSTIRRSSISRSDPDALQPR
jgi:hypothetical protein